MSWAVSCHCALRRCSVAAVATAAATTATTRTTTLSQQQHTRRTFTSHTRQWVQQLHTGASIAPLFGSWANAYSDEALVTRQLYCKALVYASGGSRFARDWIAGYAALLTRNETLLHVALQHHAREVDVARLRDHLLSILVARTDDGDDERLCVSLPTRATTTATATTSSAARASNDTASAAVPAATTRTYTPQELAQLARCVLERAPEVRCFVADALAASLYHLPRDDVAAYEEARRRVTAVATAHFGLTHDTVHALWQVALAEQQLKREKVRALGQLHND